MATAEVATRAEGRPGPAEAVAVLLVWVLLDRFLLRWAPIPACLSSAAVYWAIGAARIVETGLAGAYWLARRRSLSDLGLGGPNAIAGLRVGTVWALAVGGLVLAGEVVTRLLFGFSVLKLVAGSPAPGQEFAALLVVGGVLGPIFEELLFRGILYQGARSVLAPIPAAIVSAAIFASAHQSFTGVQPVQLAGGMLFCIAYERSGSLWAPVILHVTGNLAIFLASLLP